MRNLLTDTCAKSSCLSTFRHLCEVFLPLYLQTLVRNLLTSLPSDTCAKSSYLSTFRHLCEVFLPDGKGQLLVTCTIYNYYLNRNVSFVALCVVNVLFLDWILDLNSTSSYCYATKAVMQETEELVQKVERESGPNGYYDQEIKLVICRSMVASELLRSLEFTMPETRVRWKSTNIWVLHYWCNLQNS